MRLSDARCASRSALWRRRVGGAVSGLLLWSVGCATPQASKTTDPSSTLPSPGSSATPEQVLASARAQVTQLSHELEALRGLTFKQPVPIELQSMADFRIFVLQELDKTMTPEQNEKDTFTLRALGLVPEDFDLRAAVADLMVSEAGAYYNPETGKFYILQTWLAPKELETLVIHELDHALQDQHFDLKRIQAIQRDEKNEDKKSAISFLLEGEATYVMLRHQLDREGHDPVTLPSSSQELIFGTFRDLSQKSLMSSLGAQSRAGKLSDEQRQALEKTRKLPLYLLWSLYSPYMKGQYAVHKAFQGGGWEGVAKLYAHLPESTEQLLHPTPAGQPLDTPTELPREAVERQLGPDWSLVSSNTMGEAGLLAFFDQHLDNNEKSSCTGWDGDTYAVYRRTDGASLLVWQTLWDSPTDAEEFSRSLARVTRKGGLGPQKSSLKDARIGARIDVQGTQVRIVAGLEDVVAKVK